MEKKLSNIIKQIHDSLDGAIRMLKEPEENTPSAILNALYPSRIAFAEHYLKIPPEEARRCYERFEIVDRVVQDCYARKRVEDLMRWKGGEKS